MIQMQPAMRRSKEGLKPPPETEGRPVTAAPPLSSIERIRPSTPRPKGRQLRIVKKRPMVLSVVQWWAKYVNAGRPQTLVRTKRLLWWFAYISYQVYAMTRTLLGGRIDAQKFGARIVICEDCQSLQKRLVRKRPFVKLYCGSCGCPQWWLSELRRKNRLLKWECPQNKHERLDDPAEWEGVIVAETRWTEEPPGENTTGPTATLAEFQRDFGPVKMKRPCGGGAERR